MVFYQVGALQTMAKAYKMHVDYVRPHGALYKQMSTDAALAISIAKALETLDSWLILVGAAGEALDHVKNETRIRVAPEIHLNKQYSINGEILWDEPVLTEKDKMINRATRLIKEQKLITKEDSLKEVDFKTIHLSTLDSESVELARETRGLFPEKPLPVAVNLVGDNALY